MSSLQMLIDLFNTANGVEPPLGADKLEIGTPRVLVGVEGANTVVPVTGKLKEGIVGTVEFEYNRISLPALFSTYQPTANVSPNLATTRDAMDSINRQYGLDVPLEDVIEETISGDTATIRIVEGSYRWVGSLVAHVGLELTDINSSLLVGDLDGFVYPTIN